VDLTLSPETEEIVRRKVASGRYENVSDVIEEALRLLDERDRWTPLQAKLDRGFEQLERGEGRRGHPKRWSA
jgi:antitoxin ParD1/3/4